MFLIIIREKVDFEKGQQSKHEKLPSLQKVVVVMLCIIRQVKHIELGHEIFNNVVCATSRDPDLPAHIRSLIRDLIVAWIFYDC